MQCIRRSGLGMASCFKTMFSKWSSGRKWKHKCITFEVLGIENSCLFVRKQVFKFQPVSAIMSRSGAGTRYWRHVRIVHKNAPWTSKHRVLGYVVIITQVIENMSLWEGVYRVFLEDVNIPKCTKSVGKSTLLAMMSVVIDSGARVISCALIRIRISIFVTSNLCPIETTIQTSS